MPNSDPEIRVQPGRAPSLDLPLCIVITVKALVSGHSRGAKKESATGAGRLRECKIQSMGVKKSRVL